MKNKKIFCVLLWCGLLACTARIERAITEADALRGTQRFADALAAYEAVAESHPDSPRTADVLLRIGDLYAFNLKQFEPARTAYQRVLDTWPREPVAVTVYLRLADLAENQGDHSGVIEPLEYLLRYFPIYPERHAVRYRIATQYLQLKAYEQARIELRTIFSDDDVAAELRAQALFDMADSYFLTKQASEAIEWLTKLTTEFPASPLVERAQQRLLDARIETGDRTLAQAGPLVAAPEAPAGPVASPVVPVAPTTWPLTSGRSAATLLITPLHGAPVTVAVEVAATESERARGLMFRRQLPDRHGMWFVFPQPARNSFWMKNTMLSLDILYVDAEYRVVDIIANTTPYSEKPLTPQLAYQYVLEVPSGFAKRHNITVGARVGLGQK